MGGEPAPLAAAAAHGLVATAAPALATVRYGLLALGDRHYERFCGFGHALDHAFESAGATRLFPMVEVDNGDPQAIARWHQAQTLADGLQPLAPRSYSIASLPEDGRLRLLVRQARHDGGIGIASGWLTAHAPLRAHVSLRLLPNPAFAPAGADGPAIFIGNGSGYAGLRGHLLHRIAQGRHRNWLVFGERQQAHDAFCQDEVARWSAEGRLAHADLVFSRDQPERVYVQDRLRAQADRLQRWVGEGACLYVCGSLVTMAAGVDAALTDILGAEGLDELIESGRYRRDVY